MSALWTADEVSAVLGVPGFPFSGISFDTRSLVAGDLFVALADARDGHDFVGDAFAKGAAAALVSRPMDGRVMLVPDTLAALTALAAAARARFRGQVVAVTGSVGKTTAKEMLRRCLGAFGPVHAADASFNNHIGVPLSLARMAPEGAFGVFEIGTNHPGEILPLARLVRPDVAVVTAVAAVHIGHFDSLDAIAAEKAQIFAGLVPGGAAVTAVADMPVPDGVRRIAVPPAALLDVRHEPDACTLLADIGGTRVVIRLGAPGIHMARNAVTVLTAVQALGIDVAAAAAALDGFSPVSGRGARRELTRGGRRILLLDESYNASGASMRAALSVLALQPGRHVAVLGDMLELGAMSAGEHAALRPAVLEGADIVFACGPAMRALFDSLPGSMQGGYAADAASLAPALAPQLQDGDAVLVKGSWGSRMRDVISFLERT
jgi:UDP-N-acetylmuramoyl-tripeptide--D-alanyl-D-alanine ligase